MTTLQCILAAQCSIASEKNKRKRAKDRRTRVRQNNPEIDSLFAIKEIRDQITITKLNYYHQVKQKELDLSNALKNPTFKLTYNAINQATQIDASYSVDELLLLINHFELCSNTKWYKITDSSAENKRYVICTLIDDLKPAIIFKYENGRFIFESKTFFYQTNAL